MTEKNDYDFTEYENTRNYIDMCWTHFKYYKDAQEKLLYWLASVFTAIAATTGIFGAVNPEKAMAFDLTHIILFHVIFLIMWLFYLYKKLNADMYSQIGKEGEDYILNKFPNQAQSELPRFFELKTHYLGKSNDVTAGRSFSVFAGILILLTYLGLSLLPILSKTKFDGNGITVSWEPIISFGIFIVLFLATQFMYKKEKKAVQANIKKDWCEINKT